MSDNTIISRPSHPPMPWELIFWLIPQKHRSPSLFLPLPLSCRSWSLGIRSLCLYFPWLFESPLCHFWYTVNFLSGMRSTFRMHDGLGNVNWKPFRGDPGTFPGAEKCCLPCSEVGAALREAGRVNCLGVKPPQKCKEKRVAIIKPHLLGFDRLSSSHRRWAGQRLSLY